MMIAQRACGHLLHEFRAVVVFADVDENHGLERLVEERTEERGGVLVG